MTPATKAVMRAFKDLTEELQHGVNVSQKKHCKSELEELKHVKQQLYCLGCEGPGPTEECRKYEGRYCGSCVH